MTWTFQGTVITSPPEDCIGFVYIINNTISGRMYIGKKLFLFAKTTKKTIKLKNGKKKKKKIKSKKESDWQDYWGSNLELLEDVKKLGKDKFTREILYYCKTKAIMSYVEAREQYNRKVLESTNYYNGIMQIKIHKNHIIKSAPIQ